MFASVLVGSLALLLAACSSTESPRLAADAGSGDAFVPTDGRAPADVSADDAGTGCLTSAECATDKYCDTGSRCAGEGVCVPRPSVCTGEYMPVCGCDGKSYSNACAAATEGVSSYSCGPDSGVAIGGKLQPATCGGLTCPGDKPICANVSGGPAFRDDAGVLHTVTRTECQAVPASCVLTPTCACVEKAIESLSMSVYVNDCVIEDGKMTLKIGMP